MENCVILIACYFVLQSQGGGSGISSLSVGSDFAQAEVVWCRAGRERSRGPKESNVPGAVQSQGAGNPVQTDISHHSSSSF